jgi:hypothetical protein
MASLRWADAAAAQAHTKPPVSQGTCPERPPWLGDAIILG